MRREKMTLEDHLKTADDLSYAWVHLKRAYKRIQKHYPNSSKLMKNFYKILPGVLSGPWTYLKSELDDDYHFLITETQFKELGHIYYNLEARFEKLTEGVRLSFLPGENARAGNKKSLVRRQSDKTTN